MAIIAVDTSATVSTGILAAASGVMPENPFEAEAGASRAILSRRTAEYYGYETGSNAALTYAGAAVTPQSSAETRRSLYQQTYISAYHPTSQSATGNQGGGLPWSAIG
jgi:hypothetical protein